MQPLRTLLSVPGNRHNMIQKARDLTVDVLILDLEDSVPRSEKAAARAMVRDSIAELANAGKKVFVRINSLASGLAHDDLEAVIVPGINGINQPKPATAGDVAEVADIIEEIGLREAPSRMVVCDAGGREPENDAASVLAWIDPMGVIEGMLLAAHAAGARRPSWRPAPRSRAAT